MVRAVALRVGGVLVLLALWEAVAASHVWSEVFVPAPGSVWHQLIKTSTDGYSGHLLYDHLFTSLRRILLGSLYGVVGGIVLGLLIGLVPTVRALLGPLVTFVRTLPPLAYFSLLIIWFGIDETPKLILLFVAAMPPVAVATAEAVRGVHEDYVYAARSLGASRWHVPLRNCLL
jgi:taurine transport system permease protein